MEVRGPARLCCAQCVGMARDPQKHGPVGGESKSPPGEVSGDHRGVSSHPQHHPPTAPPSPRVTGWHPAPPSRPAEAGTWHQRWGSTCPQVWAPASLGAESSLEGASRAGLTPQAGIGEAPRPGPQTGQAISSAPAEALGPSHPPPRKPCPGGRNPSTDRMVGWRRGETMLSRSPVPRPAELTASSLQPSPLPVSPQPCNDLPPFGICPFTR